MPSVCVDGETYANGEKRKVVESPKIRRKTQSNIRDLRVQDLHKHQSTALEASTMTEVEFCADDEAGQRARNEFRKALKASGSTYVNDNKSLWALADAYSKMPEKMPSTKRTKLNNDSVQKLSIETNKRKCTESESEPSDEYKCHLTSDEYELAMVRCSASCLAYSTDMSVWSACA